MAIVREFRARPAKVYQFKERTLVQILSGDGYFQIDFKNYSLWRGKIFCLEKGQYIRFFDEGFDVRVIHLSENIPAIPQSRVLFNHVLSIGYIQPAIDHATDHFVSNDRALLDYAVDQWFGLNPFGAFEDEITFIFDAKETIDETFRERVSVPDVIASIKAGPADGPVVIKSVLGRSIHDLLMLRRFKEGQRQIAFTSKTIQEIAFDIGFNDDAYFCRFFKRHQGESPLAFRKNHSFEADDWFVEDLLALIKAHHRKIRSVDSYAKMMQVSSSTFRRKVKLATGLSFGRLIRKEIVKSARHLLDAGESPTQVALALGFEEPSHFTSFFKQRVQITPLEYQKSTMN